MRPVGVPSSSTFREPRRPGNVPSSIDGVLSATGSVYLVNPSGVVVGPSGVVKTGGSFVASTLDVKDAEFRAGGSLIGDRL